MSTTMFTLIIVFGVSGAFAAGVLLPKLLKGKAKVVLDEVETEAEKILPVVENGLTYAVEIGDAVSAVVPEPYKTAVKTLPGLALGAVKQIQTVADAGVLTSDQRKAASTKIIETDLKNANITIDTNVEKLISIAIDTMCLAKSTALTSSTAATATSITSTAANRVSAAATAAPSIASITVFYNSISLGSTDLVTINVSRTGSYKYGLYVYKMSGNNGTISSTTFQYSNQSSLSFGWTPPSKGTYDL